MVASLSWSELGTAQPQLVSIGSQKIKIVLRVVVVSFSVVFDCVVVDVVIVAIVVTVVFDCVVVVVVIVAIVVREPPKNFIFFCFCLLSIQ